MPDLDAIDWNGETSPYVHWWHHWDSPRRGESDTPAFTWVRVPRYLSLTSSDVPETQSAANPSYFDVPVPSHAANPQKSLSRFECAPKRDKMLNWPEHKFDEQKLKAAAKRLTSKSVIVGIIDTGIALGHRRFRDTDGKTRFLASWQQNSKFNEQPFLPFGNELYAGDIDELMDKHTVGNLQTGVLDEEQFNIAARLTEPAERYGHRDLDYQNAHGTHVLDLAAGYDHSSTAQQDDEIADTHIIAVNLPPQYVHGSAGNFLSYFAGFAIERIQVLADALWEHRSDAKDDASDNRNGFPVVINFSFGKLAGPKDGTSLWEFFAREMIDEREQQGCLTRLVMPVGNKNLSRSHARELLGWGKVKRKDNFGRTDEFEIDAILHVPWRILPTDHTPNFIEIWCSTQMRTTNQYSNTQASWEDFSISIKAPGHERKFINDLTPGNMTKVYPFAWLYSYNPSSELFDSSRPHFVLGVAPTSPHLADQVSAPAGLWDISVDFSGDKTRDPNSATVHEVAMHIQSDQSGMRHAQTGLPSYFDSDKYRALDLDRGRPIDSFEAGQNRRYRGKNAESWKHFGPVQRKGTNNALATFKEAIVIGGYRTSDGAPAVYSSTFHNKIGRDTARTAVSALLPSEDAPSYFGLLAAGARDGTVAMLRGTSMATGLATRRLAIEFVRWTENQVSDPPDEKLLQKEAKAFLEKNTRELTPIKRGEDRDRQRQRNQRFARFHQLKAGDGRVPAPPLGRVPRLGEDVQD